MKIVIPMARMGKRMRPHTLTTPKPLLPVAGKPIVERLVENIAKLVKEPIQEICFVIGPNFGKEVEEKLKAIAKNLNSTGTIYYQKEALGTAHAVYCAQESLEGETIVAFADTLFDANFNLDRGADGIVWVKQIDNPSAFGVVTIDEKQEGKITGFVEKPEEFVSDLAIIGIYYFKDGTHLKNQIKYLIDNDVIKGGEYQLTDVLENMRLENKVLKTGKVDAWMDFGNKNIFISSVTEILKKNKLVRKNVTLENTEIIEPCFIGENVKISNSKIGPFVSIEENSVVNNASIHSSIIMKNSKIESTKLRNSMIGNFVELKDNFQERELNVGDYNSIFINE